jgi:drug/metabolite transporter (DMT)-like permease
MSWLFFAFCGPVLWAISMHFDKYLVERFFKHANVAVLLVFTALMGLVMLPPIWVFRPDVLAFGFPSILVVIASGLLLMGAMFFYLLALQSEEASVVAPFFQASPLFAYALGYLVLGETLSRVQLIGGALVVGGALILSVRWGEAAKFKLRMVVLMLACAFASALSSLIFKIFAVREEFWATTFWTFVGQAIFGATVLAIRRYQRRERAHQSRRRPGFALCSRAGAAQPGPGHHQHDVVVRLHIRHCAVDSVSVIGARGSFGSRAHQESARRYFDRRRGNLDHSIMLACADGCAEVAHQRPHLQREAGTLTCVNAAKAGMV